MRFLGTRLRNAAIFPGLLLVSAVCGASPQQERGRGVMPQPLRSPVDRPAPERLRPTGPEPAVEPTGDRTDRRPSIRTPQADPRPAALAPRTAGVMLYPGTQVVVPPAWDRCVAFPTRGYWHHRDLIAEIQWLSRRGYIPVTAVGPGVDELSDYVSYPAGWRAYGVSVPAGGTVQVEVQHTKLGWFRLILVDKWGRPGAGMLQAAIAPQPILVTYRNPGKEATAVYVIVDDPAWWSDARDPYRLVVRRDWDPAKVDLSQVKMVAGLWGASPSVSAEFRGPSLTGPAVYPH